jgi:peptidoglycan/LPS O-acetylase OafA/YrhL
MRSNRTKQGDSDMIIGNHYDSEPLNDSAEEDLNDLGAFSPIEKSQTEKKERMYYADWLRAVAIHFVIMVHCDQLCMEACDISNPETFKRVPYNEEVIEKARGFIKSLVQCGVPLFFYISGMVTNYYDTGRKGYVQFLKGKTLRLLVPFFIACFVILIPRLYLTQNY